MKAGYMSKNTSPCSVCGDLRPISKGSKVGAVVCRPCRKARRQSQCVTAGCDSAVAFVSKGQCQACYQREYYEANFKSDRVEATSKCAGCRAEIVIRPAGKPRRWCSNACRNRSEYAPRCAVFFRVCKHCGSIFSARSGVAYTCRDSECQRLAKNEQQAAWFSSYRETHGVSYVHQKYSDERLAYKAKRRSSLAIECEPLSAASIYERDSWVCQLCLEPVDSGLKWPHPMSASLDHIQPISKGGHHVESNVQLAHVRCNCAKGNRIEVSHGSVREKARSGRAGAE